MANEGTCAFAMSAHHAAPRRCSAPAPHATPLTSLRLPSQFSHGAGTTLRQCPCSGLILRIGPPSRLA